MPVALAVTRPAAVAGQPLSPAFARRIEVTCRLYANLPYGSEVHVGALQPSTFSGYDQVAVTYSAQGHTLAPVEFR